MEKNIISDKINLKVDYFYGNGKSFGASVFFFLVVVEFVFN